MKIGNNIKEIEIQRNNCSPPVHVQSALSFDYANSGCNKKQNV